MSLINLFASARHALAQRRQRHRAYAELMSLDDRSLADIGIHRSQIPALVEGVRPAMTMESASDRIVAAAFGASNVRLATGHRWMPPV